MAIPSSARITSDPPYVRPIKPSAIEKTPIGRYVYFKRREAHFDFCEVDVFVLKVEKQATTWREQGQRDIKWFTFAEAADLVEEQGLVAILNNLALSDLGRR